MFPMNDKISQLEAIQLTTRRSCFLIREYTGLEIMPEEMFSTCSEAISLLALKWDSDLIPIKKNPESIINSVVTMNVMEWCIKSKAEIEGKKEYKLNSKKISDDLEFMAEHFERMFPGLMNSKNAEDSLNAGVSATANAVENNGFFWTKKLNEKITMLMSFYPVLQIHAKQNKKLNELLECLTTNKGEK